MYCIHCGKELPEDARFCSRCGKPQPIDTEPADVIILPDPDAPPEPPDFEEPSQPPDPPKPPPVPELGQEFYDALAAAFEQNDPPKQEEPPEPAIPVPPATEALSTVTPPEPPAKWKPRFPLRTPLSRKTIFLLIGIVLLAAALIAVAVRLVTPKPIGPDAFVYLTSDDHSLMFREDLNPGTAPKELSNVPGSYITFSEDGKNLYFRNSANLYHTDLSKAGEWNATEKVSSNVYDYGVMKNGGVVYVTTVEGENRMYYYDGWDSIQLADDTSSGCLAGITENMVFYTSESEDGIYSYYRVPVDGSAEPEMLIDGFDDILYIDGETIVYSIRDGSYDVSGWYDSYGSGEVYSLAIGGETTLLADDVGSVINITGEEGTGRITMLYTAVPDPESGSVDLCKSEDGAAAVLASGLSMIYDYGDDIFIYSRRDSDGAITYYQKINGVESELPLDEGVSIFNTFILSGSDVVLLLDTPDGAVLQAYKVSRNQLTPSTLVCGSGLSDACYRGPYGDKLALYFYVDMDPESFKGTLMRYIDGKSAVVAENVNNVWILSDGSAVFTTDEDYVLYEMNANGKQEPVTSEATEFAILSGKKIVYISNENLYVWNNGRTEKLAGGVERVFVPNEAEYRRYYCY